ncbi:MAG: hypothetical protein RL163_2454 [Pseudomonadota bacterium]
MTKAYRAIAFDTGGTVLDWHTSLLNEVRQIQVWGPLAFDRHEFVNTWRRNAMKAIVGQVRPSFNMDDVHWDALGRTITAFSLPLPNQDIMDRLWRGWHRLRAWPDFPPALRRLSLHAPVVSFTMLPISLIVNVSRLNCLSWDAVISCEMIGVYKPNQQAYQTAAQWLALAPDDILMVACHNFDLNAAQDAGYKTAFVRRPHEWGPAGPPDPHPNRDYDFVCDSFSELADLI